MVEKRTIILNSLLTLILVACIYQFIKSEYLTSQVSLVGGNTKRTQQQLAELKEAASATFEQTMRRFDEFGHQLSQIAPAPNNFGTTTTAAVQTNTDLKATPGATKTPPRIPRVALRNILPGQTAPGVCDLPCYGRMLLPL